MPTSSQSRILSVVDHHLSRRKSRRTNEDAKGPARKRSAMAAKDTRRSASRRKVKKDKTFVPESVLVRRRSSGTLLERYAEPLHLPVINLYAMGEQHRRPSIVISSVCEQTNEDLPRERRPSLLDENARRLLTLGTIRPSKTFYTDLPEADVNDLMKYFRRLRRNSRPLTVDDFNHEFQTEFKEYKPKIFFDSTRMTKTQLKKMEKLLKPYVNQIRTHQAELTQLDHPLRFVIKPKTSETPVMTIPSEYNDCLLTLLMQNDRPRPSSFVPDLVDAELVEAIRTSALDISYFPGGFNYETAHEEIDENNPLPPVTYQKLKKRLQTCPVWHFDRPPEKKHCAVSAILPTNLSFFINYEQLLECLLQQLRVLLPDKSSSIEQCIVSIEFLPLSCILSSEGINNRYVVLCDSMDTKRQLITQPLKLNVNQELITIELQSYDEFIQHEYDKFLQAEKHRELIKNHKETLKRKPAKK